MSCRLNINLLNEIKGLCENAPIDLKLKKTKPNVVKPTKKERHKIFVSTAKWEDEESRDSCASLCRKNDNENPRETTNDSRQESNNKNDDTLSRNTEEEKLKISLKFFGEFSTDDMSRLWENFSESLEKPTEQNRNELITFLKNKTDIPTDISKPNSILESSCFLESSDFRDEMHEFRPDDSFEQINSNSIKRYIDDNKMKLTTLDLCILNSLAKCYNNRNREKSRFE